MIQVTIAQKENEIDAFLEEAMQSAGVPLYRFPVKREYDPHEIYNTLFGQKLEALNNVES